MRFVILGILLSISSFLFSQEKVIKEIKTYEYGVEIDSVDKPVFKFRRKVTERYNKEGLLVAQDWVRFIYENGMLVKRKHPYGKTVFINDSIGNNIKKLRYHYKRGLEYIIKKKFDSSGNEIQSKMYSAKDTSLFNTRYYRYDINNNQIEEVHYSREFKKTVYKYWYNDFGDRISTKIISSDGSESGYISVYEYDKYNNWIEQRSYENDTLYFVTRREIVYW